MENRYDIHLLFNVIIFGKITSVNHIIRPKLCNYSYYIIQFYFPKLYLKWQKSWAMENRYDIYALFIDIIFGKIASGYYNLGFSVVFQIQFQNGVILFFGKSKQTAEISWIFFPMLVQ